MITVIGIDVGTSGGLAALDGDELLVHDLPAHSVRIGRSTRKVVDSQALIALLNDIGYAHVFVEKVGPMPRDGPAQAFRFGFCFGQIITAIAALRYPITQTSPLAWRRGLQLPPKQTKDQLRQRASELFPAHSDQWARVCDHDRAEAALIAEYGRRSLQGAHPGMRRPAPTGPHLAA